MYPGTWSHLAARFLDVLVALPLNRREQELVNGWLRSEAETELFWRQSRSDRRHALTGALVVAYSNPSRIDLIRAALLHDVGKQIAGLGVIGRTLAALAAKLSLTPVGRIGDHLRHDHLGAHMLMEAGCEDLVVDFARHHHAERPSSIDAKAWEVLRKADRSLLWRKP